MGTKSPALYSMKVLGVERSRAPPPPYVDPGATVVDLVPHGGGLNGSLVSQLRTMRSRLIRIMLVISGLTAIATFATVVMINVQTSSRHLAAIQKHIEEGIASKGKVLTGNHALALRELILDNAFGDMQRLVARAVHEDEDLAYGIFVSTAGEALAVSRRGSILEDEQLPERDGWKTLGLEHSELLVERESIRRVSRLGLDLLEVAVPVTSDEGEVLGTIRYGLSTRRMREALDRAESERSANLLTSVVWIASLVSFTTLIGLLLSRLQAHRITRPIAELTEAARALASGKRSVRVSISSGDELELLGSSFNHMVEELSTSYRQLEEMNRTLEQKVQERTAKIALQSRDMRLVLDNVDQGFATLSRHGRIMGGRSRVVGEWFGDCEDGTEFAAHISRISPRFGMVFGFAWSQIMDDILPLALAIDQLPTSLTREGRTWSFRYLPFFEAEELQGVLLVAAEITERLAREREEAEQRELMQSFAKLMLDRNGFVAFLEEADAMVKTICAPIPGVTPEQLKRKLHTLKGNAALMGLSLIASICHKIEEQIAEADVLQSDSRIELSERWSRINAHVLKFVPNTAARAIEVARHDYTALIAALAEGQHHSLLEQVRSWSLEPAVRPLERLAEQAQLLAQQLCKGELEVVVQGDGVRLDPDVWRPFFSELSHVVRNAVDHGIETARERQEQAKPGAGKLVLGVHSTNDSLTFEVRDNGRGIDWEAIRKKGQELGLPHATRPELLEILCQDGVSTRAEATEVSGRGVGMAAFKQCVARMNGRIDVQSSGLGTSWFIRFPAASDSVRQHPEFGKSAAGAVAEQRLALG